MSVVGVASDTVGALRGSPTLLVMVVLNAIFIAGAAYYLRNQQDHAFALVDKMFDRCVPQSQHQERPQ
jgi:CDP-diacylglycerol pyrophosphatase